jgi:hypothetical protein
MNSTSQILNANFINYEKVFFKKKLVSFNHIPKFEILECEILECDTCQCKKTIVSKWLPSCAHGASGHLQPSLVRKGRVTHRNGRLVFLRPSCPQLQRLIQRYQHSRLAELYH